MSDITTRIGALLAKAEGTDNEAERETYIAKAQELATKYAIDMELARIAAGGKETRETPKAEHIQLYEWGDTSQTRAFFCQLFMNIGKANNLRFLVDRQSRYVVAHGFQSDIDITKQMYTSLSLQMVSAAEAYLRTDEWRDRAYFFDSAGNYRNMTARTARRSFYSGFAQTIGTRCMDAVRRAEKEMYDTGSGTTSGALVLANRKSEIDKFYASVPKGRGSWGGGSAIHGAAFGAGREAGQRASLGNASQVSGGRTAINR